MTRVSFKQLKKLPVQTHAGQHLGRIDDAIVDIESHNIAQYRVKKSILSDGEYLIAPGQVEQVQEDKIIVSDNIEKIEEEPPERKQQAATPESVAMSEE